MARPPTWTRDDAVTVGLQFVTQHGRIPRTDDMRNASALPDGATIRRLFGAITAYQMLVRDQARLRGITLAVHTAPLPAPTQRQCLRCDRAFRSDQHRICQACKLTPDWLEPEEESYHIAGLKGRLQWARESFALHDVVAM